MQKRRRPLRLRRKAWALLLLLFLLGLFQLNQFLPGVWRSGGDTQGPRQHTASLVGDQGDRARPDDTGQTEGMRPPPQDRPAQDRPAVDVPRGGALIEVRLASGTPVTAWDYGAGESGALEPVPDPEFGRQRISASQLEQPIRSRADGREARHHPQAAGAAPGHWIVVLPEARTRPGRVQERLTLSARRGDEPVPQGQIHIETLRKQLTRPLSAGSLSISGIRTLARATLTGTPIATWFHPRGAAEVILRAPETRRVSLETLDAGLAPGAVGFVDADGRALRSRAVGDDAEARFDVEVAAGAPVFVGGRTAAGMGFLSTPDSALDLPETRVVLIETQEATGRPATGGVAVAQYRQPISEGPAELLELTSVGVRGDDGSLTVTLPANRPATIVVASGSGGAAVRRIPADALDHRLEVQLPAGRSLTLHVLNEAGGPVADALVRASIAPGVEVQGRTNADGTFDLAGLPEGPVPVFVLGAGFAPERLLIEAQDPRADITLSTARPLAVVVSDPNGMPLAGVRVEVEPESGPPRVEPPARPDVVVSGGRAVAETALDATREVPDARTNENGLYEEADLRPRAYRLRLYHPDYRPLTVHRVTPEDGRTWFVTLLAK